MNFELCEMVVEALRKKGRVMTIVQTFEEQLRIICGFAPESGGLSSD